MGVSVQAFAAGDIEMRSIPVRQRAGASHRRQIFPIETGIAGLNLSFERYAAGSDFFSPRHRHCWDQFRYVLDGTANFGKRSLKAGECGYFPEGVHYGPQDQQKDGEIDTLSLQFVGPSRCHYLTPAEMSSTIDALTAAGGVFDNGVFRGRTADGRPYNQDGYEAIWEAHQKRKIAYPAPRYDDFIIMKPAAFQWIPDATRPGLSVKTLGFFNEHQSGMSMLRFDAGAALSPAIADAAEIRFVLAGAVRYDDRDYPQGSVIYSPAAAPLGRFDSQAGAELLVFRLPMFRH